MLHGEGGDHASGVGGLTPAKASWRFRSAARRFGRWRSSRLTEAVGYWNPHPGDDPMGMVVNELIPLCRRLGLGRSPPPSSVLGTSMGGYGAILFAEKYPQLFRAVAAISPAGSDELCAGKRSQRRRVRLAGRVRRRRRRHPPTRARSRESRCRVASGNDDPFQPGVKTVAKVLPPGSVADFSAGCHSGVVLPPADAAVTRVSLPAPWRVMSARLGGIAGTPLARGCSRRRSSGRTTGACARICSSPAGPWRRLERCGSPCEPSMGVTTPLESHAALGRSLASGWPPCRWPLSSWQESPPQPEWTRPGALWRRG